MWSIYSNNVIWNVVFNEGSDNMKQMLDDVTRAILRYEIIYLKNYLIK